MVVGESVDMPRRAAMSRELHAVNLTEEQRALCERVATKCEGSPERVSPGVDSAEVKCERGCMA